MLLYEEESNRFLKIKYRKNTRYKDIVKNGWLSLSPWLTLKNNYNYNSYTIINLEEETVSHSK